MKNLVHEQDIPVLVSRLQRVNSTLNTDVHPKIVGESVKDSIYHDGDNTFNAEDKYYGVILDKPISVNGLELIGKLSFKDVANGGEPEFQSYKNKLSKPDKNYIDEKMDLCRPGCDCCGKKLSKSNEFVFKATQSGIKVADKVLEKGKYYRFDNTCTANILPGNSKVAIESIFDDFDGTFVANEKVNPRYYDAKLLAKYALAVGSLKIDEAYNYYKFNLDTSVASTDNYGITKTYRCCKKSENKVLTGDYIDGSIMEVAKALYDMRERTADTYNVKGIMMFSAPADYSSEENAEVLSQIAESYGLDSFLNNPDADKLVENIFSSEKSQKALSVLEDNEMFIPAADDKAPCLIREKAGYVLEDMCDSYCLSQGESYMHEDSEPLFHSVKFQARNGKTYDIVDDVWGDRYVVCPGNPEIESVALDEIGDDYEWVGVSKDENKYDAVSSLISRRHTVGNNRLVNFIDHGFARSKQTTNTEPQIASLVNAFADAQQNVQSERKQIDKLAVECDIPSDKQRPKKEKSDMQDVLGKYDKSRVIQGISPNCVRLSKDGKWAVVNILVPKNVSSTGFASFIVKPDQIVSYTNAQHKEMRAAIISEGHDNIKLSLNKGAKKEWYSISDIQSLQRHGRVNRVDSQHQKAVTTAYEL